MDLNGAPGLPSCYRDSLRRWDHNRAPGALAGGSPTRMADSGHREFQVSEEAHCASSELSELELSELEQSWRDA